MGKLKKDKELKQYWHTFGGFAYRNAPNYSQNARRLFHDLLLNEWTEKDFVDFLGRSYRCDIVRHRVAKMVKRKFKKS